MKPIDVFYHCWLVNDWQDVITEQFGLIISSGLYDAANSINIGLSGIQSELDKFVKFKRKLFKKCKDSQVKITTIMSTHNDFEFLTLNWLKQHCDRPSDSYILYLHTKGISIPMYSDARGCRDDWRKCMMYWDVEKWKDCVKKLEEGYDTVGCLYTKRQFWYGNFWWCTSKHIQKLPKVELPRGGRKRRSFKRFYYEQWLLNCKDYKKHSFYGTWDFRNDRPHPPGRYRK